MSVTIRRIIAAGSFLAVAACMAWVMLRHGQPAPAAPLQGYADPSTCAQCHSEEAAGYARTGMAHAFSRPSASDTIDSPAPDRQFYHAASGTYYRLTQHDGKYFQRRWQLGFDGKPENVEELAIDSIMGSGNHARTYLHREEDGTLIELPMAWYSEDGGHWGMNPGFDDSHPMTRRVIAYECIFCHNAYPQIPPTAHRDLSANPMYAATLPEGIDCQRCHGPGAAHVKAAEAKGTTVQQIRALILNPVRLSNDRQMEVCEQCHLETTSRLLPDRIRHYDREPFDYKANEPLANFISYYSRDPAHGRTDNFEIASAPYRLRQSQCYIKSQGALTCETCHNPHDLHKGPGSASFYAAVCMKCHAADLPAKIVLHQHPASNECVSCHMPKRRTEDVVHVVMTDHLIQRLPPPAKELLAPRQEIPDGQASAYHGPVVRYRLDHEGPRPNDALYDGAAQVIDSSNLEQGIPALSELIRTEHPAQPNFSIELGDALRHHGDAAGAIAAYRQALALDPLSSRVQRRLGVELGSAGQTDEALSVLGNAISREPSNALLPYERALIEVRAGSLDKAIVDLRRAVELKPDFADAYNSLGSALIQSGDSPGAEAAFREALRINPYDSGTRANLGRLLAGVSDWKQAAFHLQKAVELDPANADAHADYAVVLLQMRQLAEAEAQARAALGLQPESGSAQLSLGEALLQSGKTREGLQAMEKAEQSSNPNAAAAARALLLQLRAR
jgi:tetratricopeptide (TPR) repeat protein